jgi:hypothetical protein
MSDGQDGFVRMQHGRTAESQEKDKYEQDAPTLGLIRDITRLL